MGQIGQSAERGIAAIKAAIFVGRKRKWRRLKSTISAATLQKSFNIFAVAALSLNILATGLPYLLAQYAEAQARIPKPLASTTLANAPADDAISQGTKANVISDSVKADLAAQLKKERDGKPRDSRHVQALDEGRTANDRVYLNADGTKSLVHSFQATSYKDASGKWQNVDMSLKQDASTGKWSTQSNDWQVTFGDLEGGIAVTKDGANFSFTPVGAKNVQPIVTGNAPDQTVTYPNAWQGVNLQYKVSGSQLKESILIKSRVAQSSFAFDTTGAQLSENPEDPGSFLLDGAFKGFSIASATVGTTDGESVGHLPNVNQSANNGQIYISLDSAWLSAQSVNSFPVIIDPTLGPVPPADYYNFSSTPSSCHGSAACGGQAAGKQGTTLWRSAFNTNLSTIPSGEFPLAANLHLELKSGSTTASTIFVDHSNCQTDYTCYDSAWGESSGSVGSVADIDVTQVFMGAMWSGNTSPWMMLRGVESGGDTYKQFDDTKTTVTVVYEALPSQTVRVDPSPADGGVAITTQPTLFSSASTDADGPTPLLYRYTIGTSKSVPSYNPYNILPSVTGVIADSGQNVSNQWTIPDNVLQDGTTYYWQASVRDSLSGSPLEYSPAYSFTVDMRNGKDATQSFDTMGSVGVDLANGNLTTSNQTHSITALGGNIGLNLNYNSPQISRQGMVGSYFNDPLGTHTFPGSGVAPNLQRIDPNVNFNWGSGSPATGVIGQDNFLARWDGYFIAPQNGTYQFGTTSDDGSRIYLNANYSTAYVDQWSSLPTNVFGSTMALTTGQIVPIRYEYYEAGGSALAQLLVKTTDGSINKPIDPAWLQTGVRPVLTPHGLVGRYYTDDGSHNFPTQDDPTRLFLTRTDSSLTQNWGSGSPLPGGPSTSFMVRWTGSYTPPVTGTYNFQSTVSDGVRVTVGSTQVINAWTDHEPASTVGPTAPVSLTGGTPVPITVDYYQNTGTDQISLFVNRPDYGTGVYAPIDTTSLSPQAQTLPDGWGLSIDADGNLSYDYATIGLNSVTLRDSTGLTHLYTYANGSFTPPAGEVGHMVRNTDGTVTLQDGDGRTYIFRPDGTLKSSTQPADDRNPGALQYIYGGSPSHLTQISDAVTQSNPSDPSTATRWAKVLYAGDANCPSGSFPSGFIAYSDVRLSGLVCAVYTSDGTQSLPVDVTHGNVTRFLYQVPTGATVPALYRIERPASDLTDYGYDSLGRITSIRDSFANDAVSSGARTADGTELSSIQYDALGHVSNVTLPAATAGATRISHTYNYFQGYSYEHVTGATEPNGFTRQIKYDGTLRTTDDYDAANLDTKTAWDPAKDLSLSSTDPAGMMTTTLYDYDFRPTDQYGPAPSTWFGSDRKPLTSPTNYTPQVPHKQTAYDGSINGLAAAFYDVSTYSNGTGQPGKALFGAPKLHTTGINGTTGDVNKTWGGTPPFTLDSDPAYPPSGKYGWGVRLSGYIHFTNVGNYTFRIQSDDGVRLAIDDTPVIDDWSDGAARSHGMVVGYAGFNNTADSYHRIRLDYYNKAVSGNPDTDATLTLYMTPPGGSETSAFGSQLSPGYGLATTQTTYDSSSSVGDTSTTTNYGTNPELGLTQSTSEDPSGLNLTTSYTYESQGAPGSFLRELSKTLPGGATTQYAYWGANATADNPCTAPTEAYNQAGRLHTTTQPDPDGAGPLTGITKDNIYDDAGRIVATRYNSDPWICMTYDARGRLTKKVFPALANTTHVTRSARTITYSYNSGGSYGTLQTGISDSGSIVGPDIGYITDLLGRVTSYGETQYVGSSSYGHNTNYTYDNLGRLASKVSGGDFFNSAVTETFGYDSYNRMSSYQQNGVTMATPSYDAYSRLSGVTYPQAASLALSVGRDALGRVNNLDYTLGNGTTHIVDNETLSQSNEVVSGTENGSAKTYGYDKAGRLTSATLGTHSFAYTFGAPTTCTGTYNANAGKDANRTTSTIDGTTKSYCYDYADRLTSSNDTNNFTAVTYDAHGNISAGSAFTKLEYDSSDRSVYIADTGGTETNKRDPLDRVNFSSGCSCYYTYGNSGSVPANSYDSSGSVTGYFFQLPGNVEQTYNPSSSKYTYSLPNLHGDVMATTAKTGLLTSPGSFQYDPFGKLLGSTSNKPSNAGGGSDAFAYVGQYGKLTNTNTANDFMIMGDRLYAPTLGRFAQVDPVDGGGQNNYVYTPDPVNQKDLSGRCPMCVYALWVLAPTVGATVLDALSDNPTSVSSAGKYAKEAADEAARYTIYFGRDVKGAVRYVGITKRKPIVRWAEHLASKSARATLKYSVNTTVDSRQAAREIEQMFIDQFGLMKNGGMLYNQINSIRR